MGSKIPPPAKGHPVTDEEATKLAEDDLRRGNKPSTAARHFVHEEMEKLKAGEHGIANPRQAVAIGLSKARRAGLPIPRKGGSGGSGGSAGSGGGGGRGGSRKRRAASTSDTDEGESGAESGGEKSGSDTGSSGYGGRDLSRASTPPLKRQRASGTSSAGKGKSAAKRSGSRSASRKPAGRMSAAELAKRAKKAPSEQAQKLRKLAEMPATKRRYSDLARITSTEPTTSEDMPVRGMRAKMTKPKKRMITGKIQPKDVMGMQPQVSKLGGKVAGARIRAAKQGRDPEAAAKKARREVEDIEKRSMQKRATKRVDPSE